MTAPAEGPKVGIGVMIFKDGKVLLGKRRNAHGEGEYAFPGGHLELNESFADAARRETMEETGLSIRRVRSHRVENLIAYGRHYVHVTVLADWVEGDPQALEPEKCEGWDWYPLNGLPQPLFATILRDIQALETGVRIQDS